MLFNCSLNLHWAHNNSNNNKSSWVFAIQLEAITDQDKTALENLCIKHYQLIYLPSSILLLDNRKYNFTLQNQPATMAYTSPYQVLLDLVCQIHRQQRERGAHISVLLWFSPVELSGPSGPCLCVSTVKEAMQTLKQKWSWGMFWIHDGVCGTIYKFYLPLLRMTHVTWCGYKF